MIPVDRPGRWALVRRGTALAGCLVLSACSGSSESSTTVPPLDPSTTQTVTQEPAPSASASPTGLSPQGLSTDRYVVVSVPPGLDAAQRGALEGYVAYDQVTWDIWFTGTGVEKADAVATEPSLSRIRKSYAALQPGSAVSGTVRVAVTNVFISSQPPNLTAEITTCADQNGLTEHDADGNDITNPDTLQGMREMVTKMVYTDGTWKAAGQRTKSKNECTI